jgi:hypothetical protein
MSKTWPIIIDFLWSTSIFEMHSVGKNDYWRAYIDNMMKHSTRKFQNVSKTWYSCSDSDQPDLGSYVNQ